ncbi:MAG: DEAD/DEAH box helicase family protein [Proteobacteria bacterium]|nr:DEAD/DEAH box helicase family protein [Pseudomonadota bacterium]MBU4230818.1 DEAD/DEAH box helicase family protein [Pseudomonadota bacterium]
MNEADTCRKHVVPLLQAAGWDNAPHSLAEQRTFTNPKGRIRIVGGKVIRGKPKRADYLLRYRLDFPIAVVEAKADYKTPGAGLSQAKEYAEILDLKFAYSTNGKGIVEFDYTTGIERSVDGFPTADELWTRLNGTEPLPEPSQEKLLAPFYLDPERPPRYYQQIAINRAVDAIVRGKNRILITMATGTGKTVVAFQICFKLWSTRWNRANNPVKRPKILFLADRNILVDDPKDKTFVPFGDARHKIENGDAIKSRELYFSTYQSIAEDENRPGLYREYAPDFFDLIIIDECHRGSSRQDSSWREILEHFKPAVQIGMTATPLRKDNKATYRYFGNPIFQYSLRQGLDDGFLAPYRVHRVVTSADATGWRPTKGELDKLGREIPDGEYHTPDFEKRLSLRPRSEAIAKHLTNFLQRTNPYDKTIVFCVDQEHADEMRQLLNNMNTEIVKKHPDYVCRVTSDEKAIGKGHLSRFQELETETPVILTTSQLLSTGVDAPMVKNVVLIRVIGTMTEFKQIIGRGTRLREDYGKFYFNILDYTGTATRHFADKEFDGDPEFVSEEEIDDEGNTTGTTIIDSGGEVDEGGDEETEPETPGIEPEPPIIIDPPEPPLEPRKYYVEKGKVRISTHLTQDLGADGKQLRATEFRDYTGEVVRSLFIDVAEFRHRWSDPVRRAEILRELVDKGINASEAGEEFGNPEADPFDLLCHLAWNAPVLTRKERAARLRKVAPSFMDEYGEQARQILDTILNKYAEHGPGEFSIPDSLKVPPISELGNVTEIIQRFGGVDQLRTAVSKLQELLYAA